MPREYTPEKIKEIEQEREKLSSEEAMKEAYERKEKIETIVKETSIKDIEEANKILDALQKAESPKEKEKLEDSLDKVLAKSAKKKFMETSYIQEIEREYRWPEQKKEKVLEIVTKAADKEIEQIISNEDLTPEEKNKELTSFVLHFANGAWWSKEGGDFKPLIEIKKERGMSDKDISSFCKGWFSEAIVDAKPIYAIRALKKSAELEDKEPHQVIRDHLGVISEMRFFSERKDSSEILGLNPSTYQNVLDHSMKATDFIWDESVKEYRSLKEEK